MILYIRLGNLTILGRELEPESDPVRIIIFKGPIDSIVHAQLQCKLRERPWVDALSVHRVVLILMIAEYTEDLFAHFTVAKRGHVALDLVDAQKNVRHTHSSSAEKIRGSHP